MGTNVWGYNPSVPAAAIFLILFLIATTWHSYLMMRANSWYWIPFVIGGIFQVIGYIARIAGHNHETSILIFSIQNLTILLAPALYAASIYMVLGRVISGLRGQHLSIIPVKWLTKIFVMGDVLSFMAQCAGGGMMASGGSKAGIQITIVGLIIQLIFFGIFLVTAAVFHKRKLRESSSEMGDETLISASSELHWTTLLGALYAVGILILIRSLYRVIEFIDGYGGYIMSHEAFLYVFDALLMSSAMFIMVRYHPSFTLRRAGKDTWVSL
ncbi:RTA1 domain-containing protein [Aspergillus tubingensis]|uniref:RTA1 domain-containing protein n=1 Tax=Aspergillus tubingensis TaxID=5068 RepID=UPI001578658B|nr:RTA-like protein [Aspergillus tubingensis]GFN19173.1 RTA-like protein [Aspergillus tubingensis]